MAAASLIRRSLEMKPRLWVGAAVALGVVSGTIAGAGTYRASPSPSAWAWGLYVGFLAASFTAVVWYAVVTHGMANTVAEQTRISRQVFESTHRPSIEIIVPPRVAAFYQNENNYAFPFQLYNRGDVPAILVSWQVLCARTAFLCFRALSTIMVTPSSLLASHSSTSPMSMGHRPPRPPASRSKLSSRTTPPQHLTEST
jgi:hypothetical protein